MASVGALRPVGLRRRLPWALDLSDRYRAPMTMNSMKKISLILLALIFAGCASNSGIMPIGKDTFMVSRQAATGFSGSGTLKAEAFQEANKHCESLGKSLQVVSTHEATPPYILGNFPKAEIQFMCLESKDAELGRPKLKKEPDSAIEIKAETRAKTENIKQTDTYTELIKLDELRKKGIITDSEFEAQKKKILSSN
jgi:Short C-terminal domain